MLNELKSASGRSGTMYPGLDFPDTLSNSTSEDSSPIKILWPHRWEFDKGPEKFFQFLERLEEEVDFRLILLGESYLKQPDAMTNLVNRFESKILHSGFVESREEYWKWVRDADIAISTADHEFFGIAMMEAASQGTACLVPNRLAYPELFESHRGASTGLVYQDHLSDLVSTVLSFSKHRQNLIKAKNLCKEIAKPFHWNVLAKNLDDAAEMLV